MSPGRALMSGAALALPVTAIAVYAVRGDAAGLGAALGLLALGAVASGALLAVSRGDPVRTALRLGAAALAINLIGMFVTPMAHVARFVVAQAKAESARNELADEEFRFRLRAPDRSWQIVTRDDVRRMAPFAVAGMKTGARGGVFGVVIVEQVPGVDLEAYARMVLDNMTLEGKKEVSFKRVRFQGRDAVRFEVVGRAAGLDLRYEDIVFLHQDHGYQLLGWGFTKETKRDGWLAPFHDGFELLDGEVGVNKQPPAAAADQDGESWRVRAGRFESAAIGLAVRPPAGWRLALGAELVRMNSAAEVGLVSSGPETYLVVLPERAPRGNRAEYLAGLERSMVERSSMHLQPGVLSARFAGEPLEFRRYRDERQVPLAYVYATRCDGDMCMQILGWSSAATAERMEPKLREALEAFESIQDADRATLRAELLQADAMRADVGSTFALRNGSYVDFEHGLRWTRPPGAWRVDAGDAARAHNAQALLYIEDRSTGILGMVVPEDASEMTGPEYHAAVIEAITGRPPRGEPRAASTQGEAQVLQSEVFAPPGSDAFSFVIATTVVGERGFRMVFWGFPEYVTEQLDAIRAAIAGLQFQTGPIEPVRRSGKRYEDHRLGFAFDPGPGAWKSEDVTPAHLRPRGALVKWTHGRQTAIVFAVQGASEGEDEAWFTQQLEVIFGNTFHKTGLGAAPTPDSAVLAGRPARLLKYRQMRGGADVVSTSTHGTHYGLVLATDDLLGAPQTETLKAGFRLLP